jgi:CRISPR-associated protein Cas5h
MFPPRSTVCGLVASIMGKERHSYYELMSPDQCRVAVEIPEKVRKFMAAENFLDTDEIVERNLRGRKGRVPIPREIILLEPPGSKVKYRIYFAHDDEILLKELADKIRTRYFLFPPSLGVANALADVRLVKPPSEAIKLEAGAYRLSTCVPASKFKSLEPEVGVRVYREEVVPVSFSKGREPEKVDDFLYFFSSECKPKVSVQEAFEVKVDGTPVYGTFME